MCTYVIYIYIYIYIYIRILDHFKRPWHDLDCIPCHTLQTQAQSLASRFVACAGQSGPGTHVGMNLAVLHADI